MIMGLRTFDAGLFHVGFGIVAQPNEITVQASISGMKEHRRSAFYEPISARVCGDKLRAMSDDPPDEILQEMIEALMPGGTRSGPPPGAKAKGTASAVNKKPAGAYRKLWDR